MVKICDQNNSQDEHIECQDAGECPVPASHKRLEEAHRLWHQTSQGYEDPVGFRANLNACIQALRSVTFVLQKQKSNIPNFESWYSIWQEKLKADPILNWLVQARNRIVKEGDLETKSIARAYILKGYNDPPYRDFLVPPLTHTLDISKQLAEEIPELIKCNAILKVERLWIADDLPEYELLEALAHAYGVLSILIDDAHIQAGLTGTQLYEETENGKYKLLEYSTEHLKGRLPCMVASAGKRTVWVKLSTNEFVSPEIIPVTLMDMDIEEAKDKYNDIFKASFKQEKRAKNLKEFADIFWQWAKHILSIDGNHITLVIFILPNSRISLMELRPKDRSEKYVIWSNVANEIKRNGAKAILAIGEVWIETHDLKFPYSPPSESSER